LSREQKRRYEEELQRLRELQKFQPTPKESHGRELVLGAFGFAAEYLAVVKGADALAWLAAAMFSLAFYDSTRKHLSRGRKLYRYLAPIGVTCLLAMTTISLQRQLTIRPDNVKEKVGDWLTDSHIPFKELPDSGSYFRYDASVTSTNAVSIKRTKSQAGDLTFTGVVRLKPEDLTKLNALGQDQKDELVNNLLLELTKTGVQFDLRTDAVILTNQIQITNNLKEEDIKANIINMADKLLFVSEYLGIYFHKLETPVK
jgi:hypothetical protein